jgi:hypothetical protein
MADGDYSLVMPFVTVASKGGPHDDDSYTAGWEMASLDALLAQQPAEVAMSLHSANVPQADLIAMRHEFVMRTEQYDDEWVSAEFRKSSGDA